MVQHRTMELMVASLFEELPTGTSVRTVPPHVTIYPWFRLPKINYSEFISDLNDIIAQTREPELLASEVAHFGNRLVTLFGATPSNTINGYDIHAGVFRPVHEPGYPIDDAYMGPAWKPHSTHIPGAANIKPGDRVTLTNLTILEKTKPDLAKTVIEIIKWS